jgi:hypothetical protein
MSDATGTDTSPSLGRIGLPSGYAALSVLKLFKFKRYMGVNDAAWLLSVAVRSALPKLPGSTDLSGQVATVDVPGKERG